MASKTISPNQAKLRRIMKDHKLNSRQIAEMIGYVPETVRAWKSGRFPTPDIAIKYLELLTK